MKWGYLSTIYTLLIAVLVTQSLLSDIFFFFFNLIRFVVLPQCLINNVYVWPLNTAVSMWHITATPLSATAEGKVVPI